MKKKKTIFHDNKSLTDVICEGVIFGVSITLLFTIIASLIHAITN